jgi:hypothetical protein
MMPKSRNSSLLRNGSVNTFPGKRTRETIEERCFLWTAQLSLLRNSRGGRVFYGGIPRLHNEDLRQLELEVRECPELAVSRIIVKKFQERN